MKDPVILITIEDINRDPIHPDWSRMFIKTPHFQYCVRESDGGDMVIYNLNFKITLHRFGSRGDLFSYDICLIGMENDSIKVKYFAKYSDFIVPFLLTGDSLADIGDGYWGIYQYVIMEFFADMYKGFLPGNGYSRRSSVEDKLNSIIKGYGHDI